MLTAHELDLFAQQGYLVVPDVLDSNDIDAVADEYSAALDAAANELYARGEVSSTFSDLAFDDRYMALLSANANVFYYLGISLPLDFEGLAPHLIRAHTGPAFFGLVSNPRVLDVVQSVLGPEISTNPVQQTRLKPPQRFLSGAMATYSNVGATTWHQDFGAVMDEAADTDMLTVWVAMMDTSEEMGCLQVLPGSHRDRELTLHCPGAVNPAENYIPQPMLERHGVDPVPLPVGRGSLVLLNKFTEHSALPNISDRLRWSFDLRYQRTGQPTGRPAFPSFVLRSTGQPVASADDYHKGWWDTRERVLSGSHQGPLYEQQRWLANRDDPVCA